MPIYTTSMLSASMVVIGPDHHGFVEEFVPPFGHAPLALWHVVLLSIWRFYDHSTQLQRIAAHIDSLHRILEAG